MPFLKKYYIECKYYKSTSSLAEKKKEDPPKNNIGLIPGITVAVGILSSSMIVVKSRTLTTLKPKKNIIITFS